MPENLKRIQIILHLLLVYYSFKSFSGISQLPRDLYQNTQVIKNTCLCSLHRDTSLNDIQYFIKELPRYLKFNRWNRKIINQLKIHVNVNKIWEFLFFPVQSLLIWVRFFTWTGYIDYLLERQFIAFCKKKYYLEHACILNLKK